MIYGLTQMSTGNYVAALDYFTRALIYTPNYPSLEINLGVVNGAMGNSSQAEQHFQRAINLAPNADEPHAFYGRWLSQQGRATDAIAQLRTAISLNPLRAMQREELILAYQRSSDRDETRKTAQETLALIPGDTVASLALQSPTIPPNPPTTALNQVATLINQSLQLSLAGNYEASIAAARAALKIDPNSAEAWNNIAAGNESLHRWDEAIAAASKAIALKPDFQLARNNLAWSQQQKSAAKSGGKP
jgi:tetratricopeptide (TPR) repeat protein